MKHKEHVKEAMCYRIEVEEEDEYYDKAFPTCPGIYLDLLDMMNNYWKESNHQDQLLYIVKTILENYDVPAKNRKLMQKEDIEIDEKGRQKPMMY